MTKDLQVVPPGSTLGIIGGGHLGRMTAHAARKLGYRTHVLELDSTCTAEGVAERSVRGSWHDVRAALDLATGCDVVTVSSEDISREMIESVSLHTLLRPSPRVLLLAQDRKRERTWLDASGFSTLPWRAAANRDELVDAVTTLGFPCMVKPQLRRRAELRPMWITSAGEVAAAWNAMRGLPTVVEAAVQIDVELSVLVARTPTGDVATYAPAVSVRDHCALLWTALPGEIPAQLAFRAQGLADYVARKLEVVGLLTVELFLLADGRLVVNELVPCPHPTYNATELACVTDQFEQLVRCVVGLPLGATDILQPAATILLSGGHPLPPAVALSRALRVPGVRAHLYPSSTTSAEPAAGHLFATGATLDEAVGRALRAASSINRTQARRLSRFRERLAASPSQRRAAASLQAH